MVEAANEPAAAVEAEHAEKTLLNGDAGIKCNP